jgi:MacB-like periplasmic core domain
MDPNWRVCDPPLGLIPAGKSVALSQAPRSFLKIRDASEGETVFQFVNVMPLLGRGFRPEEYSSSRRQVVLVSQRFWQRQFGRDPRIIGMTIQLNGQTFTVIGVMPTMFDVCDRPDSDLIVDGNFNSESYY